MNQAEAEGLAAILQLFGWGLFGWILFNSPRVWARGWLIAARSFLWGLWRSVAPFHSSAPALGPPRPAQGAWGSLRSRQTELLTEAEQFQEISTPLIEDVEHRIHHHGRAQSHRPPRAADPCPWEES